VSVPGSAEPQLPIRRTIFRPAARLFRSMTAPPPGLPSSAPRLNGAYAGGGAVVLVDGEGAGEAVNVGEVKRALVGEPAAAPGVDEVCVPRSLGSRKPRPGSGAVKDDTQ